MLYFIVVWCWTVWHLVGVWIMLPTCLVEHGPTKVWIIQVYKLSKSHVFCTETIFVVQWNFIHIKERSMWKTSLDISCKEKFYHSTISEPFDLHLYLDITCFFLVTWCVWIILMLVSREWVMVPEFSPKLDCTELTCWASWLCIFNEVTIWTISFIRPEKKI